MQRWKRKATPGTSLVEMMVVLALMGIVMVSVGVLISKGVDFYLDSTNSVEIRKQLLFGTSRLTRDIADSHIDVIHTETDGIVIPSVRLPNGGQLFDDKGRLLWQQYICYYTDNSSGENRLMRKSSDIPRDPSGVPHPLNPPGPGNFGEIHPPDPMAETPVFDVNLFRTSPALPARPIVRNLESFQAYKSNIPGQAGQLVTIEMAVSTTQRQKYQVEMLTRVAPRH